MILRIIIIFFCAEIYAVPLSAMQMSYKKIELRKQELRTASQLTLKEKALVSLMRIHGLGCMQLLNKPIDLVNFNNSYVAQCRYEIEGYANIRYPLYVPKDPPAAAPLSKVITSAHEKKRFDILQIIVEKYYASMDWPVLCLLAGSYYTDACKILLSLDYINANCVDHHLRTPLMNAAMNGKTDNVKLLLERPDVDLTCKNRCGADALKLAQENKHVEVVILLENAKKKYER